MPWPTSVMEVFLHDVFANVFGSELAERVIHFFRIEAPHVDQGV